MVAGFERLLESGFLSGRRVGLVCNPASVDRSFHHIVDRLSTAPGVTLGALFGPQHGFQADVQDNMIETGHGHDRARRVPVYSLYSETREPTREMLQDLDVLVIDLQEVGTRIYTFIYTMANCLRAGRKHDVPVVVCDRPNPIGGARIEGPVLRHGFESFVGQFPIAMRHGMTMGELAQLFNGAFGIGCDLRVFEMEGWSRAMYFDATGLPWIMPSPNVPTLDSAVVYPGAVLFEGTNISEGRGTTRPFELVGAPWIEPQAFASRMNRLGLSGVYFRPVGFEPTFHKHAGQSCGGCQIHVLDRSTFRPVLTAVSLLSEFYAADPEKFAWRQPPYEYEYERRPFDLLAGSDALRMQIEQRVPAMDITEGWEPDVREFEEIRRDCLLYA